MAMDLLKQIESSRLPMYFRSLEDIDKVRLLRAAGLVIAFVPAEPDIAIAPERTAQVVAITQKGREVLRQGGNRDDPLVDGKARKNVADRLRDIVDRARHTWT